MNPLLPGCSKKYEVLEVIGSGEFGIVYKALHRDPGRAVAVKVLHQGWDAHEETRDGLVQEARITASLTQTCNTTVDRTVIYFPAPLGSRSHPGSSPTKRDARPIQSRSVTDGPGPARPVDS